MRKIINRLRPWCAMFFAVAIGIGGNAFAGHPTNHAPDHGYSETRPLHFAVVRDAVDEARRLIAAGNDVNRIDAEFVLGWSPLHLAAVHGHKDMAELLISSGANIEAVDHEGRTPLFLAAEFGDPHVVKALLDAGAQYKVGPRGQRMLHSAALNRNNPAWILSMLFPLDNSPYSRDGSGNNILHYAATNRERTGWHALKALEEISRHMDKKRMWREHNKEGNTPYDLAAWLHEQSKKNDPTVACIYFIKPFNWRGCAPQRQPGIMDILNTGNPKDHKWLWSTW